MSNRRLTISLCVVWILVSCVVPRLAAAEDSPPATGAFACDLYRTMQAAHDQENLFFSPFSLANVLTMAAEGARGQTAEEMGRVLHAVPRVNGGDRPFDFTQLHQGFATVTADLSAGRGLFDFSDRPEFSSANAIWTERSYAIELPYLKTLNTYYHHGGIYPLDFIHHPGDCVKYINSWTHEHTHGKIDAAIAPGEFDNRTRMILTNAVYFYGHWPVPFLETGTQTEPFHLPTGASSSVQLMHNGRFEEARYAAFGADGSPEASFPDGFGAPFPAAKGGFQLAQLNYKGDTVSMLVLLPRDPDGLPRFEMMLSSQRLNEWTAALQKCTVDLWLPRFKLQASYDLNAPLSQLGIRQAFVNPALGAGAAFDGIHPSSDPTQRLYIKSVAQKVLLDVTEKGTEAVAVSTVHMYAGLALKDSFPVEFRADRPFLFMIRDNASGTILFMGRFIHPV